MSLILVDCCISNTMPQVVVAGSSSLCMTCKQHCAMAEVGACSSNGLIYAILSAHVYAGGNKLIVDLILPLVFVEVLVATCSIILIPVERRHCQS